MKLLIVGGSSSLGQVLRPVLSSFAEVWTAGRAGCDLRLDLSAGSSRFDLPVSFDAVVHLAAHFGGNDFESMLAAEYVNVIGTLQICHAARSAGVGQLVLVSSIFAGLAPDSAFFSSYSLSKRHAEEVANFYCAHADLPLTVLRPGQFYGVGETFRKHQPFLYDIFDKAEKNEDIVLYGSNDARRNLMHAEDLAEVIARVVRLRILGSYPCLSLTNVRYSEIVAEAIAAFESRSSFHFATNQPDILDNAFEPDDSLYSKIDFIPQISLERGIQKEAAHRRRLK